MCSKWLSLRNLCSTSAPKLNPAPRHDTTNPTFSSGEGSDQTKSAQAPLCGISLKRSIALIWSASSTAGDRPPWTAKMRPPMMAPTGRQSNRSVNSCQTCTLWYLDWHSQQKPQDWVVERVSWLPRIMWTCCGCLSLSRQSSVMTSTLMEPRSTQSPMKRQLVKGTGPLTLKISSRSQNWPWMSPTQVTGADTGTRLGSSNRISLSLWTRTAMACSSRSWPAMALARHRSRSKGINNNDRGTGVQVGHQQRAQAAQGGPHLRLPRGLVLLPHPRLPEQVRAPLQPALGAPGASGRLGPPGRVDGARLRAGGLCEAGQPTMKIDNEQLYLDVPGAGGAAAGDAGRAGVPGGVAAGLSSPGDPDFPT